MSTAVEDLPSFTFDEFLAMQVAEQRGAPFPAGCRPFMHNRLLRTEHAAYYPDVMLVCGPAADRLYETDAWIIVEVRSQSTRDVDRREKAGVYAGLPGLHCYVIVDPDVRMIEIGTPSSGELSWRRYGSGAVVQLDQAEIDLDAFYDALDATATT